MYLYVKNQGASDEHKKIFKKVTDTGGVPDKNTPNKNPKRADWLVFLSQINWGVCPIRTRPIRTFVPD